jgi:hypothetical protein
MEIGGTTFGSITINGKSYEHDVIIRLSGEVVKRKKKLSKKYYGTSHVLSNNQRRDSTVELVTQLNELIKNYDGTKRTKLHRLIKNLITKATTGDDVLDANGKIVKEGTGDLTAILAIIDRLEGRPAQKIVGPDNGPVQVEYRTIEEVHMFLLERGIDSLRVPPPPDQSTTIRVESSSTDDSRPRGALPTTDPCSAAKGHDRYLQFQGAQ